MEGVRRSGGDVDVDVDVEPCFSCQQCFLELKYSSFQLSKILYPLISKFCLRLSVISVGCCSYLEVLGVSGSVGLLELLKLVALLGYCIRVVR